MQNRWLGHGKWLLRRLREANAEDTRGLAYRALARGEGAERFANAVEQVLAVGGWPAGRWLPAGSAARVNHVFSRFVLLIVLELIGIAVFAASGAVAAVRARLDVFGVIILALTTALGGGIIRDVLLGVHPPTSLRNVAVPAGRGR